MNSIGFVVIIISIDEKYLVCRESKTFSIRNNKLSPCCEHWSSHWACRISDIYQIILLQFKQRWNFKDSKITREKSAYHGKSLTHAKTYEVAFRNPLPLPGLQDLKKKNSSKYTKSSLKFIRHSPRDLWKKGCSRLIDPNFRLRRPTRVSLRRAK